MSEPLLWAPLVGPLQRCGSMEEDAETVCSPIRAKPVALPLLRVTGFAEVPVRSLESNKGEREDSERWVLIPDTIPTFKKTHP